MKYPITAIKTFGVMTVYRRENPLDRFRYFVSDERTKYNVRDCRTYADAIKWAKRLNEREQ